ncbi:MAG: GNAT family N-acetyltransferase [Alphaproteobacteria bacterium]|nr:GNAT family N-acetyltransferase [Alphaproteobacteria bacterium]MBU6471660.1 GNAT family N-acetyltransferase [Alphaproteobacteria bacterium]MDE2012679.1 GNAT family N-acetyltransferase [Alphaproteobacteria bacterium]MDE2072003.1 GNAT family N-acetyltransferase [Alphaproteobacteria bacterium]MDE2353004.1 GNAT family N-acetyltransferase [Alphaproteobacteria bacterium]
MARKTDAEKAVGIRRAEARDVAFVIALDKKITGIEKPDYWHDMFERYGANRQDERFFLIAEMNGALEGFIIGETRAWEFGSPPCGWVFAIQVWPGKRLKGVGAQLFEALCDCFRAAGVTTVRTMIARDNTSVLSFFRSCGLMAGPFIELEAPLRDSGP